MPAELGYRPALRRSMHSAAHAVAGTIYRASGPRPDPARPLRRVLLSGYTGLGHLILKSVVVRQLRALYPACEIVIIAPSAAVAERMLDDCEVIVLDPGASELRKLRFFWDLRRRRFDAALMPCDASPAFLIRGCIVAGIPRRVGHVFAGEPFPWYYFTDRVQVRVDGPRSELDMNLDLVEALHGAPFERLTAPRVSHGPAADVLDRLALRKTEYICVQPGAANGQHTTKRWLESHFHELFTRLLERFPDLSIVALGDSGDAPIVARSCAGLDTRHVLDVSGRTTLPETKALIAHGRLIVCHDSGLLHLGNALGVPVIALYGPSDPDTYAERLPTFHLLRESCECPKQGLFPGRYTDVEEVAALRCPIPKCMQRLSVERVLAKCVELLEAGAR